MTMLAYTRTGAGAPLVLLHGIGSSRHARPFHISPGYARMAIRALGTCARGLPDAKPSGPLVCRTRVG